MKQIFKTVEYCVINDALTETNISYKITMGPTKYNTIEKTRHFKLPNLTFFGP